MEIRPIVGSATITRSLLKDRPSSPIPRRALFNPFNPRQMFAPLTANRRRWVHTYPRGPQGEALVLHHRNTSLARPKVPHQSSESTDEESGYPFGMSNSPNTPKPVAISPTTTVTGCVVLLEAFQWVVCTEMADSQQTVDK